MPFLFATVMEDPLRVQFLLDGKEIGYACNVGELTDWFQDHEDLVAELPMFCSSALDWPWDFPNMHRDVVQVCNMIRGNAVPLTREEDEND
ncbi:MAG: hypothetical protein KJO60_11535 [Desulfofustis sp.]|nr:hypothetical protein [Desulfofustis sp.]